MDLAFFFFFFSPPRLSGYLLGCLCLLSVRKGYGQGSGPPPQCGAGGQTPLPEGMQPVLLECWAPSYWDSGVGSILQLWGCEPCHRGHAVGLGCRQLPVRTARSCCRLLFTQAQAGCGPAFSQNSVCNWDPFLDSPASSSTGHCLLWLGLAEKTV